MMLSKRELQGLVCALLLGALPTQAETPETLMAELPILLDIKEDNRTEALKKQLNENADALMPELPELPEISAASLMPELPTQMGGSVDGLSETLKNQIKEKTDALMPELPDINAEALMAEMPKINVDALMSERPDAMKDLESWTENAIPKAELDAWSNQMSAGTGSLSDLADWENIKKTEGMSEIELESWGGGNFDSWSKYEGAEKKEMFSDGDAANPAMANGGTGNPEPKVGKKQKEGMTTADIIEKTMTADLSSCWDWQVVGVCFWLKCSIKGCYVTQSVQVSHNLPDLTVSVFRDSRKNTWKEQNVLNSIYDAISDGATSGPMNTGNANQRSIKFFDVDVIGNPAIDVFSRTMGATGLVCQSPTTMFKPYFVSRLNGRPFMEWRDKFIQRFDLVSTAKLFLPGEENAVGWNLGKNNSDSSSNNNRSSSESGNNSESDNDSEKDNGRRLWGHIWPYSGFIAQEHDHKAAAVILHRAVNLVTQPSRRALAPLLYLSANGQRSRNRGYWPAGEFKPGNKKTGLVQRLAPEPQKSCAILPDSSTESKSGNDDDGKKFDTRFTISDEGRYAWNIWRPYTCCERRGRVLITATHNPK